MIYVEHYLLPPNDWYRELQKYIPSRIVDNQFLLDPSIGEGGIKYLTIQDGLWINELSFQLNEKMVLHRHGASTNKLFIINFYFSKAIIKQIGDNKNFELGFDEINMVLNSSCSEFIMEVPARQPMRLFSIGFSKAWLNEYVLLNGNAVLKQLFNNDQPIYLSEQLHPRLIELFNAIHINQNNKLNNLTNVLIILKDLFHQLSLRQSEHPTHIHYSDMEHILNAQTYIIENIQQPLTVEEMAEKAGMSASKFKRLFKQIVGASPYQFHLKCKMEKALKLIELREVSVSEVGYLVGYSNISQFSKAFKKHFGILPSKA